MKDSWLRRYLDGIRPSFQEGGRLSWLHSLYEAADTFISVPDTRTSSGAHVRDCIDLKRIMLCVVLSLLPCLAVSCVENGFVPVFRVVLVSLAVSYAVELISSQLRGIPLCEGCAVTGLIAALLVPVEIPLWALALAVASAVLLGKVAFGEAGMNIWNTALLSEAFLLFGFPSLAMNGLASPVPCSGAWLVAVGIGALLLIYTGTASWKVMLSCVAGALVATVVANVAIPGQAVPAFSHLSIGSLAFGTVFVATDPVTGAQTGIGKWIYGFLTGILIIAIRNLGLIDADGTMSAILIMNTFAPVIDRLVISANINARQRRNLTV